MQSRVVFLIFFFVIFIFFVQVSIATEPRERRGRGESAKNRVQNLFVSSRFALIFFSLLKFIVIALPLFVWLWLLLLLLLLFNVVLFISFLLNSIPHRLIESEMFMLAYGIIKIV